MKSTLSWLISTYTYHLQQAKSLTCAHKAQLVSCRNNLSVDVNSTIITVGLFTANTLRRLIWRQSQWPLQMYCHIVVCKYRVRILSTNITIHGWETNKNINVFHPRCAYTIRGIVTVPSRYPEEYNQKACDSYNLRFYGICKSVN
jgi:hypothetical protein